MGTCSCATQFPVACGRLLFMFEVPALASSCTHPLSILCWGHTLVPMNRPINVSLLHLCRRSHAGHPLSETLNTQGGGLQTLPYCEAQPYLRYVMGNILASAALLRLWLLT